MDYDDETEFNTAIPSPPVAYYDFYKTSGTHSAFFTEGPSMTRQEFVEECDINSIMRRYEQAGCGVNNLPRDPNVVPRYIDYSEVPSDLLGYMTLMQDSEAAFMTLPATIRREFENNAMLFVDFASDPENLDQMRSWGLAPSAETPAKAQELEPAPAVEASEPPSKAV